MSASRCSITNGASGSAFPPRDASISASGPRPAVAPGFNNVEHRILGVGLGSPTDAPEATVGDLQPRQLRQENVMKIVVIGGTGRIGSNVVRRLEAKGHEAVPASPATGVDTITGEGLADVMAGADVVIDVANAPVWDDEAVLKFFTTSTRNVLAAERDAGVGHHVAVSIVGADLLWSSGYMRAKVAQESEIEAGGVPYTILRSTQFLEFLPQIVEAGAEGDTVRLSTGLMQPVAADEVAATVAELATGA